MRRNVTFWLDERHGLDSDLLRYVRQLKAAREFSSAVKDGLRLIRDLRAGNLDVLFELFPWIERALYDALKESQKPPDYGSGISGETVSMAEIKALLLEVKEAQQPGGYVQAPTTVSGNLKTLAGSGKALPPPADADDLADLLTVKDVSDTPRDTGKPSASENLINSLMSMASVKSDKPSKPARNIPRVNDLSELIVISQTQ